VHHRGRERSYSETGGCQFRVISTRKGIGNLGKLKRKGASSQGEELTLREAVPRGGSREKGQPHRANKAELDLLQQAQGIWAHHTPIPFANTVRLQRRKHQKELGRRKKRLPSAYRQPGPILGKRDCTNKEKLREGKWRVHRKAGNEGKKTL